MDGDVAPLQDIVRLAKKFKVGYFRQHIEKKKGLCRALDQNPVWIIKKRSLSGMINCIDL
eukprot:1159077-Pelagomonas_calceolata.AAC.7